MIINEDNRFCFVHIPKCAGSTVRGRLALLGGTEGKFGARVEYHEKLGQLDYTHIPLNILEQYFPADYEKVLNYRSYAVVRDPHERFPSSVTQRVKKSTGMQLRHLSASQIKNEIEKSINFLAKNDKSDLLPPEYIHFQNQCSYLYNRNEQIVDNIYPTFALASLFERLSEITATRALSAGGEPVNTLNQGIVYRSNFFKAVHLAVGPKLSPVLKAIPGGDKLRERARRKMYVKRDSRFSEIFNSNYIRQFVAEYYRDDLEMYCRVTANYGIRGA